MDVYLKTKDPIEKAKRVQKKSAAAPGSYRPGGSDRTTVGGRLPTVRGIPDGQPTGGLSGGRLPGKLPIGELPGGQLPTGAKPRAPALTNAPVLTNACDLKSEKTLPGESDCDF